jgi:hypothetical protein
VEEKKDVKVCPVCSNTEITFGQGIDGKPKPITKFVPMGCLGKICAFYNEQMKQCNYVVQTILLSNITNKLLEKEIKGE